MSEINRRKFLNSVLVAATAAVVAPKILGSAVARAAAEPELPMVDPKEMMAEQLKYVEDYKKSPFAGGKKKCATCQFYAQKGKHAGKDAGTCTIFAGKWVYSNAYCNSWSEKKKV